MICKHSLLSQQLFLDLSLNITYLILICFFFLIWLYPLLFRGGIFFHRFHAIPIKRKLFYYDKDINWFFFSYAFSLPLTFWSFWNLLSCRNDAGTQFGFTKIARQFLQSNFLSFPSLFEMVSSLHTKIYLYLSYTVFCSVSSNLFVRYYQTLSFNYYSFIIYLTSGRICSSLFLFYLKSFLAVFTYYSWMGLLK